MQAIRRIISAELLSPIISLPKEFQEGEVEIIVLPCSAKNEALRHFRSMRKQAEQRGFLSDAEIDAEIKAARVANPKREIPN